MLKKILISGHQKSSQVYWQTCGAILEYNHHSQIHTFPFWFHTRDCHSIFGGNLLIPQKTEHYEVPYLFFQWNIQSETCYWSLFVCSFKFWITTYIQGDTEEVQLELSGPFSVSAHKYAMIQNLRLHTNKFQKQVSDWVFRWKREKKLHNVQFLAELL